MTGTPLLVARRPRSRAPGWDGARSWLGGCPKLGTTAWPRSAKTGRPIHFLAQIDLAEVAEASGQSLGRGALAFFIDAHGMQAGQILHVPSPGVRPTEPPADMPSAYIPGSDIFPSRSEPWGPKTFPYWPVSLLALPPAERPDLEDDEAHDLYWQSQAEAVDRLARRREYFLSSEEARKATTDGELPWFGQAAVAYAAGLRTSQQGIPNLLKVHRDWIEADRRKAPAPKPVGMLARLMGRKPEAVPPSAPLQKRLEQLAFLEAKIAPYDRFVDEMVRFAASLDPAKRLTASEVDTLTTAFERGRTEFKDFVRYTTPFGLKDLATEMLVDMLTADQRTYEALPAEVRNLVDENYLLPTGSWHQMFGTGVNIQGNPEHEYPDNVMLLQLVYDDLMKWRFGDMGAYQFWIRKAELEAGNWGAAHATFECH